MELERYKISVIGHTKKEGHIHYIINVEKNKENFSFLERYSGLRGLNDAMKKYTNKTTFPKFPPKKFFGSEDEKFITKRQQEINSYFDNICKDPDFVTLPPLIKFIEDKHSKQNANGKTEKIEKQDYIKTEEKELKKSLKNTEKDFEKIVKEYRDKFYNMNNNDFDKDNANDWKYIQFFKNNKIKFENIELKLDKGDENNFCFINNDENSIKNFHELALNKFRKTEEFFQSFDDIYNTNGILVPI